MHTKELKRRYSKDLQPRDVLSKDYLAHLARMEGQRLEESRRKYGPPSPQVQMSIRMGQGDYIRFRALCRAMRKTNGDMLLHLLNAFLEADAGNKSQETAD